VGPGDPHQRQRILAKFFDPVRQASRMDIAEPEGRGKMRVPAENRKKKKRLSTGEKNKKKGILLRSGTKGESNACKQLP